MKKALSNQLLVLFALLLSGCEITQAFQLLPPQSLSPCIGCRAGSTSSSRGKGSTTWARHATLSPNGNNNNGNINNNFSMGRQQIEQQVQDEKSRRNNIWVFPPLVSAAAYAQYDDTAKAFHQFLDWASGHTWVPADGGKYIAEITKSALTGPVTFSVSILFGSLVGLTITTLNGRHQNLRKLFVLLHQEGQEMQLLLQQCQDENVKEQAMYLLTRFMHRIDQTMRVPDKSTDEALRQNGELQALSVIFHDNGSKVMGDDFILAELYASLGRLRNCRVELWSSYTNNFSVAHYTNMVVLAGALLLIFLLETDNGSMQFLIEFQLSICWALLLGAYSLLAAVIVDLRGIPPQFTTRLDQEAVMVMEDSKKLILPGQGRKY